MIEQILIARQPILNSNCDTIGYELLYKDNAGCMPDDFLTDTAAACEVLLNAYTGVLDKGGLRTLPAFMKVNAELLQQDLPDFASDNIVLEITADVPLTEALFQRVAALSAQGFKIALDAFVWDDAVIPLLEHVDIIRINTMETKGNQLFQTLEKLEPYKLTLLASHIETLVEFNRFRKLGFQLFQGFFFAYPEVVPGRQINGSELIMVELLAELNNPDATPEQLDRIISKDPRLAVKVLKIVNSATFSLQRSISTISEAIILLGLQELKRWALIVSMSGNLVDVPDELCRELLIRAKMCEHLAKDYHSESGLGFLVGILSGADALFSIPMDEVCQHIPLSDEVIQALVQRQGDLGLMLNDVINFSRYEWDCLSGRVPETTLLSAQSGAIRWALESQRAAHH